MEMLLIQYIDNNFGLVEVFTLLLGVTRMLICSLVAERFAS